MPALYSTSATNSFYHPVKAGNIRIPGNILAAPMAGYTDRVCRGLALEAGAGLAWTEMISAEALIRNSRKTEEMMLAAAGERILAVQLFGSEPEVLAKAAVRAAELGADILDLNAGCPVPKVTRKGAGAALAKKPGCLGDAVAAMRTAGLPVSVKIRAGWDEGKANWREAAAKAVESGAIMLGFHPRCREQGYSGKADWSLITALVQQVNVPVIGSGDLNSPEDAEKMLKQTGCAGVMFARGAIGNPSLYRRTRIFLETGRLIDEPAPGERLDAAIRHLILAAGTFGEETAFREIKKHLAGYLRGWEGAAGQRHTLLRSTSYKELLSSLEEIAGSFSPGTQLPASSR